MTHWIPRSSLRICVGAHGPSRPQAIDCLSRPSTRRLQGLHFFSDTTTMNIIASTIRVPWRNVTHLALHRKPSSGAQSRPPSGCGSTSAHSPRLSASWTGRGRSLSSRRRSSSWILRGVQRQARWCASSPRMHEISPFTMLPECVQGHGEGSRSDTALRPEVLPDAHTAASSWIADTDSEE